MAFSGGNLAIPRSALSASVSNKFSSLFLAAAAWDDGLSLLMSSLWTTGALGKMVCNTSDRRIWNSRLLFTCIELPLNVHSLFCGLVIS